MQAIHQPLKGSCLCQSIQFEIENSFRSFFLCHCHQCQKMTDSAHVANLFIDKNAITWLKGESKATHYQVPGHDIKNVFCPDCGSPVPYLNSNGKLLIVPAGSLDGEPSIAPHSHIFMEEKRKWHDEIHKTLQFDGFPS
ncbi:aldehyde-activating protein [Marinomonas agarivorans]|nr:aldehyde-activating protein [Marinomonas agarivorans]